MLFCQTFQHTRVIMSASHHKNSIKYQPFFIMVEYKRYANNRYGHEVFVKFCQSIYSCIFHQLGRVGLVVTESVCLCVCLCVCPLPMRFFPRPLIGLQITWPDPDKYNQGTNSGTQGIMCLLLVYRAVSIVVIQ